MKADPPVNMEINLFDWHWAVIYLFFSLLNYRSTVLFSQGSDFNLIHFYLPFFFNYRIFGKYLYVWKATVCDLLFLDAGLYGLSLMLSVGYRRQGGRV